MAFGCKLLLTKLKWENLMADWWNWWVPDVVIDFLEGEFCFSSVNLTSRYLLTGLKVDSHYLMIFITTTGIYKLKQLALVLTLITGVFPRLKCIHRSVVCFCSAPFVSFDKILIYGKHSRPAFTTSRANVRTSPENMCRSLGVHFSIFLSISYFKFPEGKECR